MKWKSLIYTFLNEFHLGWGRKKIDPLLQIYISIQQYFFSPDMTLGNREGCSDFRLIKLVDIKFDDLKHLLIFFA